jgi:hypothetical protein
MGMLVSLVRHNARNTAEMEDLHGYEIVRCCQLLLLMLLVLL